MDAFGDDRARRRRRHRAAAEIRRCAGPGEQGDRSRLAAEPLDHAGPEPPVLEAVGVTEVGRVRIPSCSASVDDDVRVRGSGEHDRDVELAGDPRRGQRATSAIRRWMSLTGAEPAAPAAGPARSRPDRATRHAAPRRREVRTRPATLPCPLRGAPAGQRVRCPTTADRDDTSTRGVCDSSPERSQSNVATPPLSPVPPVAGRRQLGVQEQLGDAQPAARAAAGRPSIGPVAEGHAACDAELVVASSQQHGARRGHPPVPRARRSPPPAPPSPRRRRARRLQHLAVGPHQSERLDEPPTSAGDGPAWAQRGRHHR